MQEVAAIHKDAPISAQKTRLVAKVIRRQPVAKAVETLNFIPRKAAKLLKKVLESAIANAEHNNAMDIDELYVSTVQIDEARNFRRYRQRAKGRVNVITKRRCHITVKVAAIEE